MELVGPKGNFVDLLQPSTTGATVHSVVIVGLVPDGWKHEDASCRWFFPARKPSV